MLTRGATSRHTRGHAPLAKQLRWLAGLIAAFVFGLAVLATSLTLHLRNQVVRLTAADVLDADREMLAPKLAEAAFLLSETSADDLLSNVSALRDDLEEFAILAPSDPMLGTAEATLNDVDALVMQAMDHSVRARRTLAEVDTALAFFRDQSASRSARLLDEQEATGKVADAAEEELRLLNSELLLLSTTIFEATQILKELDAIARFNAADAGQSTPIQNVSLPVKVMSSACLPPTEPPRSRDCNISNVRLNRALDNLHNGAAEDSQRNLEAVRRSASAYIRPSQQRFNLLSYRIETTLDISTSTREQLSVSVAMSNALKDVSGRIARTEALVHQAEQGDTQDWQALGETFIANTDLIYRRMLKTAEMRSWGFFAITEVEAAYHAALLAWENALSDLKANAEVRRSLAAAVNKLSVTIQQITARQRTAAQESVSLVSNFAISSLALLAAMALFLVWGGRRFIVAPLEKTTETILKLADGLAMGPVRLAQRGMGLSSLEDALERLRLANIEREKLTRQTLEQRSEIEAAHQRLSTIANVAPVGLYEMCETAAGTHRLQYVSDRFLEMCGLSRKQAEQDGDLVFGHVLDEDRPGVAHALGKSAESLDPFLARFRIRDQEDRIRWMSVVSEARRGLGGAAVWTGAMIDVTADVEREEALREAQLHAETSQAFNEIQALHDGLTGLPNRRYFDQVFANRLISARQGGPNSALLMRIDLDFFKQVNDTLGHEAGDLVLIRVSDVLRRITRADDFAARIGGDEFSIMMTPGTSYDEALALAQTIQDALSEPLHYKGNPCRFGASFGLAHTDDFAKTGEDLNLYADASLYRAKDLGRQRIELFTPSLLREIERNRSLSADIQDALDLKQFEPFFQPQVDAQTGELTGAEVLMRWNHPVEGILSPGVFLPVAEQLRVVADIDRQVMEKARDALLRLRAKGVTIPKVSFNVSSERLHDPDVIDLAKHIAMPGTRVAFELLESILIEDESDVFRFHLDQLQALGIEIEIDDFGSGHASILGLLESGATTLKIDQRLVRPLDESERSQKIVRAIIEIAEILELETIAEGVETEQERRILQDMGCSVLQGYLFSRPVSEADFAIYQREMQRRAS